MSLGTEEGITGAALERYARLERIKDTWRFGNRNRAMERLQQMIKRSSRKQMQQDFSFVVIDDETYHRLTDFRSTSAREMYVRLEAQHKSLADHENMLEQRRTEYHNASASARREMREELLRRERVIEQQRIDIARLEKEVRNAENKALGVDR